MTLTWCESDAKHREALKRACYSGRPNHGWNLLAALLVGG